FANHQIKQERKKKRRVFVLDLSNSTGAWGFRDAERACASLHARLASSAELRHAVAECFFSPCTRGWLYGGMVGTTECNVVGSVLKAVDVRTENATEDAEHLDAEHLDAFCIKDKGVPCGDPPSFPNARLQGHSGYEMGDELLYTCVPGYVIPSGHRAFSLLCDSCGEWYGLVEICVKEGRQVGGELTGRKFKETVEGEKEEERPVEDFIGHPMREQEQREEIPAATDAPVSLLSQKHMFWFPSEAFQEEGHSVSTNPVTQITQRASGIQSEESKENNSQERRPHWNPADADDHESDNYDDHYNDDQDDPDDQHHDNQDDPDSHQDEDDHDDHLTHNVPAQRDDLDSRGGMWPGFIPTASPSPDTLDYDTQQEVPTHSWLDDLTEHPSADHDPAPPVHDGDVLMEHNLHKLPSEMGETICTGENCPPSNSSGRGPKVAAIIVVVCLIVTAVVVGVWCYRRQQQKSSMYEMNQKVQSQTRTSQQIEMQQKV
uniref:Sushi domain containing 5 n=1 Tax=Mola mola TaxID=94237 RepID=A0A3Q4BUW3_MOLML